MKTLALKTLSIPVLTALLVAGCQKDNTPAPGGEPFTPSQGARQMVAKANDFSFDFLKGVHAQQKPGENIFVSPVSLHMALGMLLNGADGKTAEEMRKTLRLDGLNSAEANAVFSELLKGLPNADPKVTVKLANAVFYRNTFTVEKTFQDVMRETFGDEIAAKDFSNPATVSDINRWASDNTNGKVPKVIKEISDEMVMFLMNALYFKGDWKYTFDASQTQDAPFTQGSGQTANVRMMRMKTNLRHAYRPAYAAFELPYGNGSYSMTVLLPNRESSVDALLKSLSASEWNDLQQNLRESKVDIGLPKFTMEYEVFLNKVLADMGMPTVFTDAANLTKINRNGGLAVSFVKQNTFVAVDEKGTEAAAVTTIGIELTSAGPDPIVCDRPFVFLITEKGSGAVLFMGKIVNPVSK